jgi:hypothetical protein
MKKLTIAMALLALAGWTWTGCGAGEDGDPFELADHCGLEGKEGDAKMTLCDVPDEGKEDSVTGAKGLPTSVNNADTAVWEIRNQWADTNTTEAAQAGLAWPASSGLNWDEKFDRWVESMRRIPGTSYYETFELTTPTGKTIQAPLLECAEVAMFLRITFASWYGLPFFLEGTDSSGNRLYFGHFGARTANGRYGNTPLFKSWYTDHTSSYRGGAWPVDAKLRDRKIPGNASDIQTFLGSDVHAGAFFDEIFLNKRVGYFLALTLAYFGSVNLASTVNTYNLKPEAIKPGDILVERWQKRGIGHVMVLKRVDPIEGGNLEAEIVSGSMPRRQPKWESPASSKHYFTLDVCGGPGSNSDGDEYAKLGGGVRRFRAAQVVDGRWTNVVLSSQRNDWLSDRDFAAIAARPARFEDLLGEVSPEQKREVLLRTIEDNREHLRRYPASCSARTRREEAFTELYALNSEHFGLSAADTDRQYRQLEDYVFAELLYEQSKTCCWNSTTVAMYEIVMDYNHRYVDDNGNCREPVVFKAQNASGNDGYDLFRQHAVAMGRGAEWVTWSEDEPCSQRGVLNDTEEPHSWIPSCELGGGSVSGCPDAYDGNSSQASAARLGAGSYASLKVCDGVADWFEVDAAAGANVTVTLQFAHASGDLDMEIWDASASVARSNGSSDAETATFTASGTRWIKVFGYQGDANTYTLTIAVDGGSSNNDPCPDVYSGNDTRAAAVQLAAGTTSGLQVCQGNEDWFRLPGSLGASATVTIQFSHASGDLDLQAVSGTGAELASSAGTSNSETVDVSLGQDVFVRVYGYNGAANTYSLTVTVR